MLIAINYHYVRPSFEQLLPLNGQGLGTCSSEGIHGVTPTQLEEQLKLLSSVGEFVDASQVRRAVTCDGTLPENALLVTFDDGLLEQFDYAIPVLQKMGIPALFFVTTAPILTKTVEQVHKVHLIRAAISPAEFSVLLARLSRNTWCPQNLAIDATMIREQYPYDDPVSAKLKYVLNFVLRPKERKQLIDLCFREVFGGAEQSISASLYMGKKELQALRHTDSLGSHGHRHLPLGLLPLPSAIADITQSLEYLASWSGGPITALSYPYGSFDACRANIGIAASQLGVNYAFTMERAGNTDLTYPLQLARFDCNDLPGGKQPRFRLASLFGDVPSATWYRMKRDGAFQCA